MDGGNRGPDGQVYEKLVSTERRIERLSRHCARIVLELRREGDRDGAARFEAVAIEAVELVRRGAL
jgi:hypothetical protein